MAEIVTGPSVSERQARDEDSRTKSTPSSEAPSEAPASEATTTRTLRLDSDRDLSRVGFWSLALGGLGILIAIAFLLAGGVLPGVLVLGFSLICGLIGALALALVAHHQG